MNVKYERLFLFCYVYGRLGYVDWDCTDANEEDYDIEYRYGEWLNASLIKSFDMVFIEEKLMEK